MYMFSRYNPKENVFEKRKVFKTDLKELTGAESRTET